MIFTVWQKDEQFYETTDIPIYDETIEPDVIMASTRRMWREICQFRDSQPESTEIEIVVKPILDGSAVSNAALTVNVEGYAKTMSKYANAFLPKKEGNMALEFIFKENCLCMKSTIEYIKESGDIKAYAPSRNDVFSFHFYDPKEWASYSMTAIAGADQYLPFDIDRYSDLCTVLRQCPGKCRPMAWVNPHIIKAFIESADSDIKPSTLQTYASVFIIVASLNDTTVTPDNRMAAQLWDSLMVFTENEDMDQLREFYANAEKLIRAL